MVILRIRVSEAQQKSPDQHAADKVEQTARHTSEQVKPREGHDDAAAVHEEQGLEDVSLQACLGAVVAVAPCVTCVFEARGREEESLVISSAGSLWTGSFYSGLCLFCVLAGSDEKTARRGGVDWGCEKTV